MVIFPALNNDWNSSEPCPRNLATSAGDWTCLVSGTIYDTTTLVADLTILVNSTLYNTTTSTALIDELPHRQSDEEQPTCQQ